MKAISVATCLALMVALLAGCASSRRGLATASFASYHLSFRYPARWHRFNCAASSGGAGFSSSITYVSTLDAAPPCGVHGWPDTKQLGADGVIASWSLLGTPGVTVRSWRGQATSLGGRPAHVATIPRGPTQPWREFQCGTIGGQETMTAAVSQGSKSRLLIVIACLRGPNLAAGRASIRQMLHTIKFTKD